MAIIGITAYAVPRSVTSPTRTGRSATLTARAITNTPTGRSKPPIATITPQPWQIPPATATAAVATRATPPATRTVTSRGLCACRASTMVRPVATTHIAAGNSTDGHAIGVWSPRIRVGGESSTQPTNQIAAAITRPSSR